MDDTSSSPTSSPTINISVKTLDGNVYPFQVPPSLSVNELKQKIEEVTNVPVAQQRLIFQGKVLKDGPLESYSIKDGIALHMVTRPAGVAPSTIPPAQSTPPSQGAILTPPSRNIVVGTITIPTDQQGSSLDLNNLVSNVLATIGVPLTGSMRFTGQQGTTTTSVSSSTTSSSSQGPSIPLRGNNGQAPTTFGHRQQLCDVIDRLLNTASPSTSEEEPVSPPAENMNPIETVGYHLKRLDSINQRTHPLLERLNQLLSQESTMTSLSQRRETQQLASQLAPILQQTGTLLLLLSPALSSLQMGEVAGQAQSFQTASAHSHVVMPAENISIHIQNVDTSSTDRSSTTPTSTTSTTTTSSTTTTPPPTLPFNPFLPQGIPTSNPAASAGASPLFSMFGPMFQTMGQQQFQHQAQGQGQGHIHVQSGVGQQQSPASGTQETPQSNSTAQQPDFSSMMASVLQSLRAPPSPNSTTATSTTSSTSTNSTQQSQSPPQPQSQPTTPPLGNDPLSAMMSQLLGGGASGGGPSPFASLIGQLFGGASSGTTPQSVPPQSSPSSTSSATTQAQRPSPSDGRSQSTALLSSMISVITQAMGQAQGGSTSPPTVGEILSAMSTSQPPHATTAPAMFDDSPLGEILLLVMDKFTVPDLLRLLNGDWSSIEPLQGVLSDYLYRTANLSPTCDPALIDSFADDIVRSLSESLDENTLPNEVKARIVPGHNITKEALVAVRRHTAKLLRTILTPVTPTPSDPYPFACAVRSWAQAFAGELVGTLSLGLQGGVSDVPAFINWFILSRLTFIAPEAASMAASLITSYIMNAYANHEQTQRSTNSVTAPTNTPFVSTIRRQDIGQDGVPVQWHAIIAADQERQSTIQKVAPSPAYSLGGVPPRKRKE